MRNLARGLRALLALLLAGIVPACNNSGVKTPNPPVAPSGLTATAMSSARIDLAWTDNSDNEAQFLIYRSEDGGATYALVGSVGPNVKTFSDVALPAGTQFYYQVTANNLGGASSAAGPANATTSTLAWSGPITTGTPGMRGDHTAIYDSVGKRMIVFGGFDLNNGPVNDVWSLDLTTNPVTWSGPVTALGTPPAIRFGHSAVFDAANNRMIVFAGIDGNTGNSLNDVAVLNLNGTPTWITPTIIGTPPEARSGHTAVYDQARQRMLVYGGITDATVRMSDTYSLSLNGTKFTWTLLDSGIPIQRTEHSAIVGPSGSEMVIFGGVDAIKTNDGSFLNNETWSFELSGGAIWSQLGIGGIPPSFRQGHSAIYDAYNQQMVLFGGNTGEISFTAIPNGELWSVRIGGAGNWRQPSVLAGPAPAARYGHTAIYDPVGKRMLLYGGNDATQSPTFDDVWILPF